MVCFSCRKENPVITPCEHSLPGLVCKEYHYLKGDYIGYIQNGYNTEKQLVQQDLYPSDHNSVRYIFQYSSKGQILAKKVLNTDGEILEHYDYQYNNFDSLASISYFKGNVNQCLTTYEYNSQNNLEAKKSELHDGSGFHYSYQYDGQRLYKETIANLRGELLSFSIYHYYSNGFKRISHYDAGSEFTNSEILHFTSDGKLLDIKYYSFDNKLVKKEIWSYEDGLLTKYALYDADNIETAYNVYQY